MGISWFIARLINSVRVNRIARSHEDVRTVWTKQRRFGMGFVIVCGFAPDLGQ